MTKLKKLVEEFEAALQRVQRDPAEEPVHKLRVSIRRLQAGVRSLKRTMKLAGAVRELDIAGKLLAEANFATAAVERDRKARAAELVAGVSERAPVKELTKAISDYFNAGDKAFQKKTGWTKLHRFRLESKHIRYTLELYVDSYGKLLEEHLKEVKQIQTYLGDINDLIATRALLKGHVAMKQELKARAEALMEELRAYWKGHFANRREAWLATIAKPKVASRTRTR